MWGKPTTRKLAATVVAKSEDVMRERGCRCGGIVVSCVVPAHARRIGDQERRSRQREAIHGVSWPDMPIGGTMAGKWTLSYITVEFSAGVSWQS